MRLTFSVLAILFISDQCLAACGCIEYEGQLYIQYVAPVTGWYIYDKKRRAFKRSLTLTKNDAKVEYLLYSNGKWWYLLQESTQHRGTKTIGSWKKSPHNLKFICPPPTCTCPIFVMNGPDHLRDTYFMNKAVEDVFIGMTKDKVAKSNIPYFKPAPARELRSLENLACDTEIEIKLDKCAEGKSYRKLNNEQISITRASEGDFWWIENGDNILAVSNNGAHCLEDLPNSTKWLVVNGNGELQNPSKKISIKCIYI